MPKGQVTEEDLASGLKGLSGFGALGGAQKVRRDSPFRDSRAESKVIEVGCVLDHDEKNITELPNVPATPKKAVEPQRAPRADRKIRHRVADIHTERITLQLSP